MVATSDGGHWVQMRRMLPAFDGMDVRLCRRRARARRRLGPARYYRIRNVSR